MKTYTAREKENLIFKSEFWKSNLSFSMDLQGVYTFDEKNKAIQVDTFCVHGSPDGYITGIRGVVKCVGDAEISMAQTEEERQEMIASKCYLKFPFIPFIPKEPYDVIDTDYDTFALVSGAKDKSFVQVHT